MPMTSAAFSAGAPSGRVVSIDIFRGITMAVMIFVNALSSVRGLPWWTYHAHADENAMTYVDMVFPFFLFIVGMSLPLSVDQRLRLNPSRRALWGHLLARVAGLLVLGLILANAEFCSAPRTGMPGPVWALASLAAAALYLNAWPRWERFPLYAVFLRGAGLAGVAVLLAIFRRMTPQGVAWLDFDYPEILGLIGISYLALVLLYVPTRRWHWAPLVWFAALTVFCGLCAARVVVFPEYFSLYVWPFGNGAMVLAMMAGVVTTDLFLDAGARRHPRRALRSALWLAVATLAAGAALAPLGISKIRATPTWALWSAGAAMAVFALLYWVCDVRRWTAWAWLVRPAGANTLTTYLLPDVWEFLCAALGFTFLETHWNRGWAGIAVTLVFTVLVLLLSRAVTRARVRLRF